jgi:hypothetical protein
MPALLLLLLLFATPFWEAHPPAQWTEAQVRTILTDSPWVQEVGPNPMAQAVLATARPVEEAEAELARRGMKNPLTGADPSQRPDVDYLDYVKQHREDSIVLAIPYPNLGALGEAEEQKRLEHESVMRVGRKQYRLVGHFPPTPSDPVLRLIFPRVAVASDRTVSFDLYLPGISQPARMLEFRIRDLMYHGKLEM